MTTCNVPKAKRDLPLAEIVDMDGDFEILHVYEGIQTMSSGERKYALIVYKNGDFAGNLHRTEGLGTFCRNCFRQTAEEALAFAARWWDLKPLANIREAA